MPHFIEIIHSGFYTSLQDSGRLGYAHLGVPESGAVDMESYTLANAVLNNDAQAAMLECTLVGPIIKFYSDTHFVITGGDAGATLDGVAIATGIPTLAKATQVLSLSTITNGSRCYLAFAGGLKTEIFLGSRSWMNSITPRVTVKKGMTLPLGSSLYGAQKQAHLKLPRRIQTDPKNPIRLIATPGPEYSRLSKAQRTLLNKQFTVSPLWNRMAVQLNETIVNQMPSMYTSPVLPGTIQLTPSGRLIILMRDCQTTGGYPRILQMSSQGLNALAQMQQGDTFLLSVT